MFPFSATGSTFGGDKSSASAPQNASASFGGYGAANYNFGGGSIGTTPNYWLIGGAIVAGLIALKMLQK